MSCLLVSTLYTACTMFYAYNAVSWAFKRRNISNGTDITVIFRQNRRTIAFYELFADFDALYSVHYVLRLKCSKLGVCTTKSLQRVGNYSHFLSKSTNGRVLRVVGMVSTLNTAGDMFCALHAVIWSFKRRTVTNGKEITVICCQNRRMVALCELLGWCRRLIQRALCSVRHMQ
jgi:hypothetical protein